MRSVVYENFGSPEKVLSTVERDQPAPGTGQVLVRMVLSPIHNHDLMTIAGQYGFKPALPAVPGTEAVGVVAALGEGVSHVEVGQRVAGGGEKTWADYYLADAKRLVPVPDSVSDETACQLVSMPLSAKMIIESMSLKEGDWIALNAANGAVGKLVMRFAAEQGINVLGLVRRDETVAELSALGINNIISTASEGWQARAKALTGGAPVIKAIDSLGGDGPAQLLSVVADGAELVSFGAMTQRPLKISAGDLLFRGITIKGFWGAKPPVAPERIGVLLGELVTSAAKGELDLPVDAVFGLDQVIEAVTASGEPGRKGKVVLRG